MKTLIAAVAVASLAGCKPTKVEDAGGAANRGTLEQRVKHLEDMLARREEALAFLEKVYGQQKQQQQAQEANEPDPNAMFAVDIKPNIEAGLVEGPATGAQVTIVEAWDFA